MNDQTTAPNLSRFFSAPLSETDPEIAATLTGELARQQDGIELIASENIVSRAVMEAQGSVLTNKYAEGYPGRRYYGGCEVVDIAESLAIERAKKLFDCSFANVQPHSGAQANQAVFFAPGRPPSARTRPARPCGRRGWSSRGPRSPRPGSCRSSSPSLRRFPSCGRCGRRQGPGCCR